MRKSLILACLAVLVLAGAAPSLIRASTPHPASTSQTLQFSPYEPQKVAYHLAIGGGWFGRDHRQHLKVLSNHVSAVAPGGADLRVVMQGDGLDLLVAARKEPALAASVDKLKKSGVRFLICSNTLAARNLDADRDLYGVMQDDLVAAGVAELSRLQGAGYVYLKF